MSFGYGIGDLLAIINITERIAVEIKAYKSAPSNFQRFAIELGLLTKTCTHILQIEPLQSEDAVRMETIRKCMFLCLRPLEAFAEKMKGSERSLGVDKWLAETYKSSADGRGSNATSNRQQDNTIKQRFNTVKDRLHWSTGTSKDVDELRAVVAGQMMAVNSLLNLRTWECLRSTNAQSEDLSEKLHILIDHSRAAAMESRELNNSAKAVALCQRDEIFRLEALNQEDLVALKQAIHVVGETSDQTQTWTEMLVGSVGYLGQRVQHQVNNLTTLNENVTYSVSRFMASCTSIAETMERNFRMLLDIYQVLLRFERTWLTKAVNTPILGFDDPFGNTLTLPFQMCNTWQRFNWLLGAMFQDKPGRSLVQRGSFVVMPALGNKVIDAKCWEHLVVPGDHLFMSMVFRCLPVDLQRCPRCSVVWKEDYEVIRKSHTCKSCKFWFSTLDQGDGPEGKVVTLDGNMIELYEVLDAPKNDLSLTGPPNLHGQQNSRLQWNADLNSETDLEEDSSLFRRIHFIVLQNSESGSSSVKPLVDTSTKCTIVEPTLSFDTRFNTLPEVIMKHIDTEECPDITHLQPKDSGSAPKLLPVVSLQSPSPCPQEPLSVKAHVYLDKNTVVSDRKRPHRHAARALSKYTDVNEAEDVYDCRYHYPRYLTGLSKYEYRKKPEDAYPYYYYGYQTPPSRFEYTSYPRPRRENASSIRVDELNKNEYPTFTYYSPSLSPNTSPCCYSSPRISTPRQQRSTQTGYSQKKTVKTDITKVKTDRSATEADRVRAGIPKGYSLKHWNPEEDPIMLVGSVFDANSLGKWIYDWTCYYHGAKSPTCEVAADLWLSLIKLADYIKRAEEGIARVCCSESKDVIRDFLESGDRIFERFKKLLKVCEQSMRTAAIEIQKTNSKTQDFKKQDNAVRTRRDPDTQEDRPKHVEISMEPSAVEPSKVESSKAETSTERPTKATKKPGQKITAMGLQSSIAFVQTMFGPDQELERTEKLMMAMRLWKMRFDANCKDILQLPEVCVAGLGRPSKPFKQKTVVVERLAVV